MAQSSKQVWGVILLSFLIFDSVLSSYNVVAARRKVDKMENKISELRQRLQSMSTKSKRSEIGELREEFMKKRLYSLQARATELKKKYDGAKTN